MKKTEAKTYGLFGLSLSKRLAFAAAFAGEIPGNSRQECGNYLDHALAGAKALGAEMAKVLENWQVADLQYKN